MTGYKLAPSYQANIENINYHVSMGHTAEAVAKKFNISRDAVMNFHLILILKLLQPSIQEHLKNKLSLFLLKKYMLRMINEKQKLM